MHRTVSKSDVCWVLVKVAGVYLVYTALATLFGALVGWLSVREAIESLPESRKESVLVPMRTMAFSSLVPLVLGVYLLKSGKAVYRCFMSIPAGAGDQDIDSARSENGLCGAELVAFNAWIGKNPEIGKRPEIDQIALFRDAQRDGDAH